MNLYHGTNHSSASSIIGPPQNIDVTVGGGELGRGFYTSEHPSLAASLATGRHGYANRAVIEISMDVVLYLQLRFKTIHRQKIVHRLWQTLHRRKETHSHLLHCDIVVAPFATIDFSEQQKFESAQAETLLNSSTIRRVL